MAKMQEQYVVISLSKLLKNSDTETDIISDDVKASIEAVVQEIVGEGIVVEIQSEADSE